MKKKQFLKTTFLALALTLGGTTTAWADEVSVTVSNDAELKTAYETAYNSETAGTTVITMNAGSYVCQSMSYQQLQFPKVRSITLQAAADAAVTLTTKVQCDGGGTPAGSLTFKGLSIRSTADNFITIEKCGNIDHISFINCDITGQGEGDSHQWYRYIINSGNASYTLNTISFDGCTIHDMGNGYNLLPITHKVQNVSVTNSTLYNYKGDKFFNPQTATDEVFTFTFNNNTVYKWGTTSNRNGICHIDAKCTNASNVITFKDNIFWDTYNTANNNNYLLVASSGSRGTLIEQNNLLYNHINEWNTGTFTKTIANLSYTGEAPFWDVSTYDFRILSTSELATASTTGGVIGDPRWLTDPIFNASVAPLSRCGSVSLSGTGVLNAGESVTATATANYGYTFVKWVDADDTQLSTANPYVFTSVADATIKAVFEVNTSVYQELPLSSASAYMDLSKAITSEGVITTTVDNSKPYYIAESTWKTGYSSIKGIPANGASNAYIEFKVHNSTEGFYVANYQLNWTNSESNYSYPTITITDDETGEVVEQTFGQQNDNAKNCRITAGKITTGYKTIRYFFNNYRGGNNTEFTQANFTAYTCNALPLVASSESASYLDLSAYSSKKGVNYESSDQNIGSVKNGYYIEYYINNENATAHYALRMGVTKYNEGTMNVTITDANTSTDEATGTFTISEGSNYANYIFNLDGTIKPGIKKIRFDFAIESNSYILNFNHVTFFKTDVNISAAGAATLVLPFDVTIPDGLEAYTLNYKSGNAAAKATAVSTTISKDTPVLLNANQGTYTFVPSSDVQAESTNATPTSGALHGTYAAKTLTSSDNAYVLQNGAEGLGFYQVGATDINVGAYRAYLVADGVDARMLSIDFSGDETTGISEAKLLNNNEKIINNNVFDLQGRRVAQPTRGLYIVNGKKLIIK